MMTLYMHALSGEVTDTGDAKLGALYEKLAAVWVIP